MDHGKAVTVDNRRLRIFLLKAGLFVTVWGALFFKGNWRGYGYWEVTWAAILAVGLLFPAPVRPVRALVVRLGAFIGQALSWTALAFIYWLGIVPLGLGARLAGKKFMPRGKDPSASSYWEPRSAEPADKASLERQY